MKPSRKAKRPARASALIECLEHRTLLSGGNSFDGGTGNAIAMASDGTLYVAYYRPTSATTGDLRYAVRDADGTWRAPGADGGIIDNSSTQVGLSVSMALDSTGKPGIAYFDGVNADLRYAHFNGSTWDTGLVYSSTGRRGNYPSIAFQNDKPTISHFVRPTSATTGYLAVDQAPGVNPSSPTAWTTTTVDNSGTAGRYSSLVFNSATSKWGIAYTDSGLLQGPRYVETSGSSVTSGWGSPVAVPQALGNAASQAVWNSLVFDSTNRPAFAYYNDYDASVVFEHRNGALNTWNATVVDGHNTTGKYPNLMNDSGTFWLAYFDDSESHVELVSGGDTNVAWTSRPNLTGSGGSELKAIRRGGVITYAWAEGPSLFVNNDQGGVAWTKQSGSSAFGGRREHTSVVFDDNDPNNPGSEMWVIGGGTTNAQRNDVLASNDGLTWRVVHADGDTTHTAFSQRLAHASLVFDNGDTTNPGSKMWVIGGQAGATDAADVGDVWWSQNGQDWTKMTSGGVDVNIGARRDHAAVVFNGMMYAIGGITTTGSYLTSNGVVSSSDGATWTAVSAPDAMTKRYGAVALNYGGAIYVIGATAGTAGGTGTTFYDTFVSNASGTAFSRAGTPNVNLGGGSAFVYENKMWVVTGAHAYWSVDGVNWVTAADDPDGVTPFNGRNGITAFVFAKANDTTRMWLLGGYVSLGQQSMDDVWSSN